MTTLIVDSTGVRPAADLAEVQKRAAEGTFCWLDIVGEDQASCSARLHELGLEATDVSWAVRFGQAGRVFIGPTRLRAATWIAGQDGELIEIHLVAAPKRIATLWAGDPGILDPVRRQFAERIGNLGDEFHLAAAILLQLLLGALDAVILNLDARLDEVRLNLEKNGFSADFASQVRREQQLQILGQSFSRYSAATRSATVGIEVVPGVTARGAAELNDYVEQVEDFEEQLNDRRRLMADVTHEFANGIIQHQGEQINRLTLVSTIFLPVTALAGFFGMNFAWLNNAVASMQAFLLLGVLLPVVSVCLSIVWLSRRGFLPADVLPAPKRPEPSSPRGIRLGT